MHDIRWIRENPDAFDAAMKARGADPASARLIELDRARREAQTAMQEVQEKRNTLSKEVGKIKSQGGDADSIIAEVGQLKERHSALEKEARAADAEFAEALADLPNLPAPDVPVGPDEAANEELRQDGDKPGFDFAPKQHFELGEAMGAMDFERAAKLSGSRFVILSGELARLERALAAFMLDIHTREFGYTEISPPLIVKRPAIYGTGQLPKFEEDLFETSMREILTSDQVRVRKLSDQQVDIEPVDEFDRDRLGKKIGAAEERKAVYGKEGFKRLELTTPMWLIPTAEVPLTNLVAQEILDEKELPLRFTALTPCFRAEAGAAGKDTRGMLRQHQFQKVELVSITHPDASEEEHERMTSCAEEVLKRLELHYRVMVLSTGDMGFAARKTYDIEVWLPGQDTYREISSCSNCWDFQARRMDARYRPAGEKGTRFVHTLNGSGIAVGRALIAVLENYQQEDGTVAVPHALRPYLNGLEVLGAA